MIKKSYMMVSLLSSLIVLSVCYSTFSIFSLITLCAPALGCSGFGLMIISCLLAKKIWLSCLSSVALVSIIKLFYLPSLCASLYWFSPFYQKSMACVALTCMPLFWLHPVGYSAGLYAFFWLIPMLSLCIGGGSVLARALGSTFVAHALGSVLFIYVTPHNSAYWLSLIPYVILERMTAVVGMLFVYQAQHAFFRSIHRAYNLFIYPIPRLQRIKQLA